MIRQIVESIMNYEGEHGRKPDYVMIHPERMAEVWREWIEMTESGEITQVGKLDPKEPICILDVQLRESVFLPMRDSKNQPIAFFLALDPINAIYEIHPQQ